MASLAPPCMPTLALRPARPDDVQAVAELLIGVRRAFMPYAPLAHPDGDVRAWVQQHLLPSGGVSVLSEPAQPGTAPASPPGAAGARPAAAAAVMAVIATSDDGACRWIDQMAVAPAWVSRGLGSRLLAHALATLAPPVRLYTFQANTGARRFYERHGFVAIASSDGQDNEEHCPDVLYERCRHPPPSTGA